MRLFLHHPDGAFFVRELSRKTHIQMHAVRRELMNLVKFGCLAEADVPRQGVTAGPAGQRRYYRLNTNFVLYNELRALLLKAQMLLEQNFVRRIQDMGQVRYLALTGRFVGVPTMPTDLLVVGKVNRERLERLVHDFERELGAEVRFTVMPLAEFAYRKQVADKFLYELFDGKKVVVVNELT